MSEISVRLEAPEFASPGEPVSFAVVVVNHHSHAVDVHLQGRDIVFDVTVTGEGGRLVWRRLGDGATQAILRLDTFAPGESRRLEGVWDQRDSNGGLVEPGFYTLQATLPTDGEPLVSQDCLLHITPAAS
jgi:hypothetical protein